MFLKIILLCVSSFTWTAASASPYQMPNTESKVLTDQNTGREYELYIKLPEGYSSKIRYPVVYLTDSWYTFPIVAGAIQMPMSAGKMEKVIIVGISKDLNEDKNVARMRDYTPTTPKNWKMKTGEAEQYLKFISGPVFNYIDTAYSTDKNRRTYVGVSLGGILGAYVMLSSPEVFSSYVLASPALWFDNEYIFRLEKEYSKTHTDLNANIYLSVGSLEVLKGDKFILDMVNDSRRLYEVLKSRGYKNLNIKNVVVDSADHETSFPTSSTMGLYWLFGKSN